VSNIKITHWKKTTLIIIPQIIFFIVGLILYLNNYEVDYNDYIIESILTSLAFTWLILVAEKLENFLLTVGLSIFTFALFSDVIDELKFVDFPEWSSLIFEKYFMIFAFIFITIGIYKESQKRQKVAIAISKMAYTDALTELPNRHAINDKIETSLGHARTKGTQMAIFILDFDNFKYINDIYGHEYGDQVLIYISNILWTIFNKRAFIGRLGGDEYLAIVEDVTNENELMDLANRTIHTFNEMHLIDDDLIHLSVSIGIASYPNDGEKRSELLQKADNAMYQTKKMGKNGYKIYDENMEESNELDMKMKIDIIEALKNKEFEVFYHPIVSIADRAIISVEALIRWRKDGNYISPMLFIPIAEKYGLIHQIDFYVLEQVCDDIRKSILPLSASLKVSVNLSSRTLINPDLITRVKSIINNSVITPSKLSFEITETAIIHNAEISRLKIDELRAIGFGICLDDFGTGFSSLSHVRNLPITCIKIDKTFIDGIGQNFKDENLIKAVLSLTDALEINTISEGVETEEQLRFLVAVGCKNIQGYYFFKPMPIEELQKLLKKEKRFDDIDFGNLY